MRTTPYKYFASLTFFGILVCLSHSSQVPAQTEKKEAYERLVNKFAGVRNDTEDFVNRTKKSYPDPNSAENKKLRELYTDVVKKYNRVFDGIARAIRQSSQPSI